MRGTFASSFHYIRFEFSGLRFYFQLQNICIDVIFLLLVERDITDVFLLRFFGLWGLREEWDGLGWIGLGWDVG